MISSQLQKMKLAQKEILKQALLAMSASVVHTIIFLFYYLNGYTRMDGATYGLLFGSIWLGNFFLIGIYVSGQNMKFKDPLLTIPLMTFLALGIVVSSYYLKDFRLSVMMIFFGVLLVGAFRLKFISFMLITLSALAGYALVLYLIVQQDPTAFLWSKEILEWFMFSIVALSIAVTGARISALQTRLNSQHEDLNAALEKVQELAMKDELTGLFNRRHIMDVIEEQKAVSDTGDYSFVVCYLDLDFFKRVNDDYGHHVGDIVLKRFSSTVLGIIRAIDYGGRMGGEEFIVILVKTKLDGAKIVAERLRTSIEEQNYDEFAEGLKVTCSIGLTEYRLGESIEAVMQRADQLLYTAKETGRNKVVTDEES